jgi:hypothetical protein
MNHTTEIVKTILKIMSMVSVPDMLTPYTNFIAALPPRAMTLCYHLVELRK